MKPLGQVLVESCGISPEIIAHALALQKEKGGRLGEILVQQKQLLPEDLLKARSRQCGLELMTELPLEPRSVFHPQGSHPVPEEVQDDPGGHTEPILYRPVRSLLFPTAGRSAAGTELGWHKDCPGAAGGDLQGD